MSSKHILAVTACPSGVAHTFMAAEKLEAAARALGYTIDVETHGSIGVEGTFTRQALDAADAVVIAADKQIDLGRFDGKRVVVTKVAEGIHHPQELIERALTAVPLATGGASDTSGSGAVGGTSAGRRAYTALMNGVSHMIPFVVAGGILLAVSMTVGGTLTQKGLQVPEGTFWYAVMQLGALAFGLMVPILSGYIAYAIADRPGLAPGMITGLLAVTPAAYGSQAGTGFIGGIITGFLSGFVALAIKKVKVHPWIAPIWPIIVIPVLSTLTVGLAFIYLIGGPVASFFTALTGLLGGMQSTNAVLLGVVLGAMIGFDMGGPVNKVAFLFAGGLIAAGNGFPMGMVAVAIAVPPIGLGIATFVKRSYFTPEERQNGIAAVFTGFFGITEGAIPFAGAHPLKVIPANIIGSAVGAGLAGVLLVGNQAMWGGPVVALLGAVNKPLQFLACVLVGACVTAFTALTLLGLSGKHAGTATTQTDAQAAPEPGITSADLAADSAALPASAPAASAVATAASASAAPASTATARRTPSKVLRYICLDNVELDCPVRDRDAVIRRLAATGLVSGQVADLDGVVDAALAREQTATTAVGHGLAIPHAKTDAVTSPMVAFARIPEGVDWNTPDATLVDMAFLIAVPKSAAGTEHLQILASLARALSKEDFRSQLGCAASSAEVLDLLAARL